MFITVKFLHYFALLLGGTATIGPMILMRAHALAGADGPPPPAIRLATRAFGITGLVAILLLWISGLVMLSHGYDGAVSGPWFTIKLICATAILLASATLNIMAARAARTGTPVNPAILGPGQMIIRVALILALICAVLTFS